LVSLMAGVVAIWLQGWVGATAGGGLGAALLLGLWVFSAIRIDRVLGVDRRFDGSFAVAVAIVLVIGLGVGALGGFFLGATAGAQGGMAAPWLVLLVVYLVGRMVEHSKGETWGEDEDEFVWLELLSGTVVGGTLI